MFPLALDADLAAIVKHRRQLTDMMNRNDLNNQHLLGSRSKICKYSATDDWHHKIKKSKILIKI